VSDAAAVLQIMAGVDERDNYTSAIPDNGVLPDYVEATKKYPDLKGVRLGVPRNGIDDGQLYGSIDREYQLSVFEQALDVLRGLGAEIIDNTNFTDPMFTEYNLGLRTPGSNHQSVNCGSGFVSGLAAYLDELTENPNNLHSVNDTKQWTMNDPREDYPDRNVGLFEIAMSYGFNESDPRSYAAWKNGTDLDIQGGVTGTCNRLNLTAMIIPTEYAPVWVSSPSLPAVSVPMGAYPDDIVIQAGLREHVGVAPGIPFGLTFMGRRWDEATLIGLAAAFEKAANFRESYMLGPNATVPTTEIADVRKSSNGTAPSPSGSGTASSPSSSGGATSPSQSASSAGTKYGMSMLGRATIVMVMGLVA
jgi:amidase